MRSAGEDLVAWVRSRSAVDWFWSAYLLVYVLLYLDAWRKSPKKRLSYAIWTLFWPLECIIDTPRHVDRLDAFLAPQPEVVRKMEESVQP